MIQHTPAPFPKQPEPFRAVVIPTIKRARTAIPRIDQVSRLTRPGVRRGK